MIENEYIKDQLEFIEKLKDHIEKGVCSLSYDPIKMTSNSPLGVITNNMINRIEFDYKINFTLHYQNTKYEKLIEKEV